MIWDTSISTVLGRFKQGETLLYYFLPISRGRLLKITITSRSSFELLEYKAVYRVCDSLMRCRDQRGLLSFTIELLLFRKPS